MSSACPNVGLRRPNCARCWILEIIPVVEGAGEEDESDGRDGDKEEKKSKMPSGVGCSNILPFFET